MINRLFILECDLNGQNEFDEVGRVNLLTSVEKEEGTLAMYSAHNPEKLNENYVFEVYKDEEAYQIHIQSKQFIDFIDVAKKHLTNRKAIQLNVEYFVERSENYTELDCNKTDVIFNHIRVKKESQNNFKKYVIDYIQEMFENEPSILAMYASTVVDSSNEWYILEFSDKNYIYHNNRIDGHEKITDMADIEKMVLVGNTLVNKGYFGIKNNN